MAKTLWFRTVNACLFTLLGWAGAAFASTSAGITYQGRLLDPTGVPVVGNVQFKIQLRTPNNSDCLMYQETKSVTLSPEGEFVLTVNDGTGTILGGSLPLDQVFANRGTLTFTHPNLTCGGTNTYNPNSSDGRKIVVSFNDGSGWEDLPSMDVNFVPSAIESMQVGGYGSGDLLRVDRNDPANQTVDALTFAEYGKLVDLINGVGTTINSGTIGGSTAINTSGNITAGNVTANNVSSNNGAFKTVEVWKSDNSQKVTLTVQPTLSVGYTLALPLTDGDPGQILSTDGSGTLSWVADGGGGGGGATSVGLTMPNIFSVTNSPVTTTGSLTASLVVQNANKVFAGPTTGVDAVPAFRTLVADDIPSLNASKITSGQLAVAQGGTGATSLAADKMFVGNAGGTALITFTCAQNKVLKFDASGNPSCGDDNTATAGGPLGSVGLSMPGMFSVTNSPLTADGSISVGLAVQNANKVFAGPTSGGDAAPAFRTLASDDIPSLNASKISAGQLAVAQGGTGRSTVAANGLLYASALDTIGQVTNPTNNSVLLSTGAVPGWSTGTNNTFLKGSTASNVTWSAIDLATADVTGTLPVTRGGTGATSLAADKMYVGNAGGTALITFTCAQNKVLKFDASGNPSCGDDNTGGGGGGLSSVGLSMPGIFSVSNSPLTADGSISVSLAVQNANKVLAGPVSGGDAAPAYRSLVADDIPALDMAKIATGTLGVANGGTGAATLTANRILVGNGTSAISALGAGTAGQMLQSAGASAPVWSTATYPATGGTTGTILRSDGTNFVNSTATYPNTISANALLYGSGANTVGQVTAPTNNSVLLSTGAAPTWATGSNNTFLKGSTAGNVSWSAIDLATADVTGTLPVTRGGTGATALAADKMYVGNVSGTALQTFTCVQNKVLKFDASGNPSCGDDNNTPADNLGNHTATANIQLGSNWLSGDGNNEGIRIDANGQVGIGTTTPSALVHLEHATTPTLRLQDTTNGAYSLVSQSDINLGIVNYYASGHLVLGTNGTEQMRLTSAGFLGLGGEASPDSVLSIKGNASIGSTYAGSNAAPANGLIVEGNVGIGTATLAASAALDVVSTTKGFLPPRMTTANRNAIGTPSVGLTVFNTTTGYLEVYNGSAWASLGTGGLPQGAVVAFNSATCPVGWTAVTSLRGRVVIGSGTLGANIYALGDTGGAASITLSAAQMPSHTHTVDPPSTASTSAGAHTHTVDPVSTNTTSESAHTHSIDPPSTATGAETGHTHSIDPPSTALTINSDGDHSHGVYRQVNNAASGGVRNSAGMSANYTDTAATTTDGAHTHTGSVNIAAFTSGASSGHTHSVDIASFTSAAGSAHNHSVDIASTTSSSAGSHAHDTDIGSFSSGSAGSGSAVDNRMPYAAFIYCEKTAGTADSVWSVSGSDINYMDGSVGIGTATPGYMLHVNGSVAGIGAYNALSDERFKSNIQEIQNPLDQVLALRGVTYDWKAEQYPEYNFDRRHDVGVIAQEVEKVVPEAVTTAKDGIKTVAYSKLIAPIIGAIKELYMKLTQVFDMVKAQGRQIASLQEANVEKEERIQKLEEQNAALKAYLCEKDPNAPICR